MKCVICVSQTDSCRWLSNQCRAIYIYIYNCAHKFTYPLQNVQNVNNYNKIRGIMKIACYFLLSTVLNKLFHITEYIYATIQNNNWIYKNDHVQKFTYPWILILCVISWMIHDWLVGPLLVLSSSVLRKILQLLHILWFSSIFCIF